MPNLPSRSVPDKPSEVVHIVLWKLRKPDTGTAEALAAAKASIANLLKVPGCESMHLGPPLIVDRTKGFDWGMYSVFSSPEALKTYAVSKEHVDCVTNHVKPNVEDVLAYDFELSE